MPSPSGSGSPAAAPEIGAVELLGASLVPRPLPVRGLTAGAVAVAHGLTLVGPDRPIEGFALLSRLDPGSLGYLATEAWLPQCAGRDAAVVVTTADLARRGPAGLTYLVTAGRPREVFYGILRGALRAGRFCRLRAHRSPSARVAPSAVVADHVHIDDRAEIGPHVAVGPNTYVGPDVVIKANATIGGDGFETAELDGRRRIVPHAGGVWLSSGVHVGSSTCIDRGLFGEFTALGPETLVDNLVHIAHAARLGRDCSIIACSEISGSVTFGDGVWLGPGCAVNPQIRVGDHAYIGTAAVITRDVPAHALAYGAPAKVHAHVCACRTKLGFRDRRAACVCGRRYVLSDEGHVSLA